MFLIGSAIVIDEFVLKRAVNIANRSIMTYPQKINILEKKRKEIITHYTTQLS